MKKCINQLMVSLVSILLCLLNGCFEEKTNVNQVVIALFDVSNSTNSIDIRKHYFENYKRMILSDGSNTVFLGDIITDNSLLAMHLPIDQTTYAFDFWTQLRVNETTYKYEQKLAKDSILTLAKSILSDSQVIKNTSILDAMLVTEKLLQGDSYQNVPNKRLIIFSDGIEQSSRYDFAKENLTERRIQQIIENEKSSGRFPNLHGVSVWLVGIGLTISKKIEPERIYMLQNYWFSYFQATGADVKKDRIGTMLLNYNSLIPEER